MCLLLYDRCPGWGAQKTVEFRSCRSSGGCAMLGSTMDTCSVSFSFWKIFYDFVRVWEDSDPEVDSRGSLQHGRSGSSRGLRLLVLLVMHVALCSR